MKIAENLADGAHSLASIAERSQLPIELVSEVAATLAEHGLLKRTD